MALLTIRKRYTKQFGAPCSAASMLEVAGHIQRSEEGVVHVIADALAGCTTLWTLLERLSAVPVLWHTRIARPGRGGGRALVCLGRRKFGERRTDPLLIPLPAC